MRASRSMILSQAVLFVGFGIFCSLYISCSYVRSESDQLSIKKRPNNSRKMRLDGFYYCEGKSLTYKSDVYFFYTDGVLQHMGAIPPSDFSARLRDGAFLKKVQSQRVSWGLYRLSSDSIYFERWYHGGGSEKLVLVRRGIVINDSTFRVGEVQRTFDGDLERVNETYHFKKFHPKPDSTNEFID